MTAGMLFTGLGYGVGAFAFWRASVVNRLSTNGIAWVALSGFAFGILGAKVTQAIAQGWPTKVSSEVAFNPQNGGRALLGGLIFGWVGVEVSKRVLGIRRSTGDLFAIALPIGEAFGRIGCYFNECCYGTPSRVPWAVYQHGAWRHPAQIYSSVVAMAEFFIVLALRKRFKREGELFLAYLMMFGASRFLLEFVRWRESLVLGLSPMQWFCLQLAAVSTCLFAWRRREQALLLRGI